MARFLKPGNERPPTPDRLVPPTFQPPDSIVHLVSDNERWETLAVRYSVDVKTLIWENFHTNVPEEVNWYLHNYVGCDTPTVDGYNWTFTTSARRSPGSRAGKIFIPQKPTAARQGPSAAEILKKENEELQQMLEDIKKSIREGQEALNEISCAIATDVFRRRGMHTDSSLEYLGDDRPLLLNFIECMIIKSPHISPFVAGHPNASHSNPSSPIGDLADIGFHPDYHFTDALKNEGIDVGKETRGLFDWHHRKIHLPDDATFGQALHEGVHTFSSTGVNLPPFLAVFGKFLYEGVTQHYTDLVLTDHGWSKATRHKYQDELKCAGRFIREFGFDLVANAYFRFREPPLADAVTRRFQIQTGDLVRIVKQQRNADLFPGHVLCEKLGYL